MGLFRMGMRHPRREEVSPSLADRLVALQGGAYQQLAEDIAGLVQRNSREQNAATAHAIISTERQITRLLENMMHTLEETLAVVTGSRTKIDSLVALVDGLRGQVKDALGATATPSMQMRIDQVFDAAKSNADAIDKAITDNTVAATAGAVSDGPSVADLKATGAATQPVEETKPSDPASSS